MSGSLLVRLRIGHTSHLLAVNPPTHRYTIFVQSDSGGNLADTNFVQKLRFSIRHRQNENGEEREILKIVDVEKPPYRVAGTTCAEGFPASIFVSLDGQVFKMNYYINFSEQSEPFHSETIYVSQCSAEFISIARRFGADNLVRSSEREYMGLPGLSPLEEKSQINGVDRGIFPFMELPPKIIVKIFSHLDIHDRWHMRLNRKLRKLEKVDRPVIPVLKITSSAATPDGATLISPANPSLDYGSPGVDFIKRLYELSLYNIGILYIQFVIYSSDKDLKGPFDNFRRDFYRAIGAMTAETIYVNYSYMSCYDFESMVQNKTNVYIDNEYSTFHSKGYVNVVKKMFSRTIACRCLSTPIGKNDYVFGYVEDQIANEPALMPFVQTTADGIEIDQGGFRLKLSRTECYFIPSISPCNLYVKIVE